MYSIKDLEQLTGIKAHTLRIWEQRYQFIQPKRTDSNIRLYDDEDLKLLLNVAVLNKKGLKISKIVQMPSDELYEEVLRVTENVPDFPDQIQAMIVAMIDLDELSFVKILDNCIQKVGFETTIINIIYPFLNKIGILWQTGTINPAQEHFISNLIRQKVVTEIDKLGVVDDEEAVSLMFYLPEGELHEISLLFACYLAKVRNSKVTYLGQNVPLVDLKSVYNIVKPHYVVTTITSVPSGDDLVNYLNKVAETFKDTEIVISGLQLTQLENIPPENIRVMKDVQQFIHFVERKSRERLL